MATFPSFTFAHFATWLDGTAGSVALRESIYLYPAIAVAHVLALSLSIGLLAALDLRLLGWLLRELPLEEVERRLLSWAAAGFVLMAVSGSLLWYANPARLYHSPWLRLKLLLIALAAANGIFFTLRRGFFARSPRLAGAASLALWIGVVFLGRGIAQSWFDCDRDPPAFVALLSGCVAAAP